MSSYSRPLIPSITSMTSQIRDLAEATKLAQQNTDPAPIKYTDKAQDEEDLRQPNVLTRVLIIDDDPQMQQFILQELQKDERILVVGHAGSVREGRKLITQNQVNVLLVDLNLSDGTGFELIEFLKLKHPTAEAIVISALEDEQHALHAFELGATGYLIKNRWFGNFGDAVMQVMSGGASISPSLARRLLQKLEHTDAHPSPAHKTVLQDALTSREKAVLKLISAGYTSPEIAQRMGISALTVSTHCRNIFRKLHVKNRAQAVSAASNQGLLS